MLFEQQLRPGKLRMCSGGCNVVWSSSRTGRSKVAISEPSDEVARGYNDTQKGYPDSIANKPLLGRSRRDRTESCNISTCLNDGKGMSYGRVCSAYVAASTPPKIAEVVYKPLCCFVPGGNSCSC